MPLWFGFMSSSRCRFTPSVCVYNLDLELTGTNAHYTVAEDDISFEANLFGPRRPISTDSSSEACLNMAASWLERCASSHESCPPQAAVPLPTRLIDIPEEGQECRLHISTSGEKGHYVTLSHCWGPDGVKFLLKKANLEQLRGTIHIQDLPKSFQDAITITRRFGFRFLWIDAICIIQDSVEDWAHESARMAEIYRNGILMISAVAAPDSQHGILEPRDVLRSHRFGRHKEFVFQTRDHVFDPMDAGGPLHGRGWCLQERIMAPRILHFGNQKLVWECVSQRWAEDTGFSVLESDGLGVLATRASAMPFIWPPKPGLEMPAGGLSTERLAAFYQCIDDFTKRKLTKRSDKLPAFSGLASAFQTPELGAYIAGLWEKDLVYGLNWRTKAPESDEELPEDGEYIAPSWSWASMHGRCEVRDTRHNIVDYPLQQDHYERFKTFMAPQLLSYHIELATSDPYGRLSAASITLRGYTRPLLVWLDRRQAGWPRGVLLDRPRAWGPRTIDDGCMWMFGPPHEYATWSKYGNRHEASESDKNKASRFVALPVSLVFPGTGNPSTLLSLLVLEPIEGLEHTYRRVGLGDVIAPSEMSSSHWEQMDLTLI